MINTLSELDAATSRYKNYFVNEMNLKYYNLLVNNCGFFGAGFG